MRVVKFKELGGVLPQSGRDGWIWRQRFYLHGHGNQLLNKSKTNNMYKWVFDVFCRSSSFVFLRKPVRICLDVKTHPVRDVCVRTHFSSQGQKAQKGPSLVQSRDKDRNNSRTAWLFPSVRWSKSWNLSDGLCV